jgi:hypothetical protein
MNPRSADDFDFGENDHYDWFDEKHIGTSQEIV